MSANYAIAPNNTERKEKTVVFRKWCLTNADAGYLVEFSGAIVSWFLDKPSIAVIALGGKGVLQFYRGYLNHLPENCRIHHTAVRNTLLGSGLLMALPVITEGSPLQWLLAALLGSLIAWIVLITTGCLQNSCPRETPYDHLGSLCVSR